MKNNSSIIILGIIAIVLIAGSAYSYFGAGTVEAPIVQNDSLRAGGYFETSASTTAPQTTTVSADAEVAIQTPTVSYSDSGFSPAHITIKVGDKVTFINKSTGPMWVASAMHPSHTTYSGTSRQSHCPDTTGVAFDQCADGAVYTFTFTKTGTWNYHNHLSANKTGSVIVQ